MNWYGADYSAPNTDEWREGPDMIEEKIRINIAYVFAIYQMKKLLDIGLITSDEMERLDKKVCQQLNAVYKYSCNIV